MMIYKLPVYFWALIYSTLLSFAAIQHVSVINTFSYSELFFEITLSPQKLLFNTNIFVAYLFYVTRIQFLNPIFLIRYQKNMFKYFLFTSISLSVIFVVFSQVIILFNAIYLGLNIDINSFYLLSSLKLLLFVMFMYQAYVLVVLLTYTYVFSILFILIFNFLILILYHGLVFAFVILDSYYIMNVYWVALTALTMTITMINRNMISNKEFIL